MRGSSCASNESERCATCALNVQRGSHPAAALFVVRVTNRASSRNPIERVCPFVDSETDARVRLRRPYTHSADSTRIRARSDDACVTILHFRAVIDGVHTSRRTFDLDASSFLSFLSFPTLIQLVPTQTRRARFRCAPGNRSADKYCL